MNDYSHVYGLDMQEVEKYACCGEPELTEEDVLDQAAAVDLAELFRTMGDANRMRIISLLIHHELCVHDVANLLGMSQSAVSHQMRALRQMRLVKSRKEGRNVYYTLDDDHVAQLFAIGLEHLRDA